MNRSRHLMLQVLVVALALFLSINGTIMAQGASHVRFMHAVPNTADVDIYVNGGLAVSGLAYGEVTGYINVPAGEHVIAVAAAGSGNALWQQTVTVGERPVTLIASSAEAGQFAAFEDNLTTTAVGSTRLLLIHALAGAPSVDVQLAESIELNGVTQEAGTVIASNMGYGASFGAFDLPTQDYIVNVIPTGGSGFDTLLGSVHLPLNSGTSYMAVIYGTPDNPQAALLAAPTAASADSGLVRFVHGVVDAPAVDVFVNGMLIGPGLTLDVPTAHIALPAGEHSVALHAAGSADVIVSGDITVDSGSAQTVVAMSDGTAVSLGSFSDDVSAVNAETAVASVINTISDSQVSITLDNGTELANGLGFGESSAAMAFSPESSVLDFTLTFSTASGEVPGTQETFYGGVYYDLIVLDGTAFSAPTVLVVPTVLAQGLNSAPNSGVAIVASNTEVEQVSETASQPQQPQQPVFVPPNDVVTGEVVLDPSANLHLRQYPRADALSLGLAPSGTILVVEGREGAPVALVEGQDPPPEAETWVDPATLLVEEDDDLDPATTWLNVVYTTPDAGEIEAWVLAQYLIVRDKDGDLQRLADLPMRPGNVAGQARDTELTPPPIREDIVTASVFNLNVDARLNLRRTPTTDGEVLARLAPDTVVELVGLLASETFVPEEAEWAFISYNPPEGGVITGWASTLFLEYQWNGRDVDVTELFERNLTGQVEADVIGRVRGGAEVAPLPTPDPLEDAYVAEVILNADARLQFRRSPDAQSESLNLIPSGTRLIIEARTAAGDWLKTTYEGEAGWISSQFVAISFNGKFVEVAEIPVDDTLVPAATEEPATSG